MHNCQRSASGGWAIGWIATVHHGCRWARLPSWHQICLGSGVHGFHCGGTLEIYNIDEDGGPDVLLLWQQDSPSHSTTTPLRLLSPSVTGPVSILTQPHLTSSQPHLGCHTRISSSPGWASRPRISGARQSSTPSTRRPALCPSSTPSTAMAASFSFRGSASCWPSGPGTLFRRWCVPLCTLPRPSENVTNTTPS